MLNNIAMLKKQLFLLVSFFLLLITTSVYAQNLNLSILKSINPENPSSGFWKTTSSSVYFVSGGIAFGSLASGLIKKDRQLQINGYESLISIAAGSFVSEILKTTFNETRPGDKFPNEVFPSKQVHGRSFPSGHTTLAFATATTLALQYKKWYVVVPAYLWASCVGYSRMYLGKHYPSDVFAGAIIGIGAGYFSHWVTKKVFKKNKN
jgi:membrane-associated phospholipid phosphatase